MTKSFTDICLERAEKATPGPWLNDSGNGEVETLDWRISICARAGNYNRRIDAEEISGYSFEDKTLPDEVEKLLEYDNEDDMEFIANARTDVPELARRLKRACELLRSDYHWEYRASIADELEAMSK